MGSKLGTMLSLIFSIFVFVFAVDLIALQSNYTNLESIASSVSTIVSTKGSVCRTYVDEYLEKFNGVKIVFNDSTFEIGEFTDFSVVKSFSSMIIFKEAVELKVFRTVLIGQYEKN